MLDKNYKPIYLYHKEFQEGLKREGGKPFYIALERGVGEIKVHKTGLYADGHFEENLKYAERLVKTMLWCYGGYKFYFWGDGGISSALALIYSQNGRRAFDKEFMEKVYCREMEFVTVDNEKDFPQESEKSLKCGANRSGCRIGFDAGGSDRKVTACVNDKIVCEKEVVWHPKLHCDIEYHIEGIRDSIDMALEKLPAKPDFIGVSTAGIVVENEVRVSSLFRKISEEVYREKVFPIYKNLEKEYGCPVKVANDGDVAALSGAFQTGSGKILGIAMGTSLAGGYIGAETDIKGYLNELAFIPVDMNEDAPVDEWSGDSGVGGLYHSQDAAIRLANECGMDLSEVVSPAEKLKVIQKYLRKNDGRAVGVFERMGDYFAYTLMWLRNFYDFEKVIFMGRAVSGEGGEILLKRTLSILEKEKIKIDIILPDEKSRRLGQSYTAALL